MGFLVVLKDGRPFLRFRLDKEDTTIGRNDGADVYIPDARVSRIHAVVRRGTDGYRLYDRSTNGTFVNGVRTKAARLHDQDVITVGSCQIRFEVSGLQEPPPTVVTGPDGGALSYDATAEKFLYARPVLEVRDGPMRGRRIPLQGEVVTIGSDRGADVRVEEGPAQQCLLLWTADRYALRPVEGSEPVLVDGRPAEGDVAVALGSTIRVGRTSIRLVLEEGEEPLVPMAVTRYQGMVGTGAAMRKVFAAIDRLARHDAPVIVLGETGTGKELVARALHARSHRARGPFVAVNCSAISSQLVESELFGYERGAFTGADRARKGAVEAASGGVLFLDELGDMPLDVQAKLLRVLETATVTPVGSFEARPVDVRVVAATHRDLAAEVGAGRFRSDLFFRLFVLTVELPPLRERREDIPALVQHFLKECSVDSRVPRITTEAVDRLVAYHWPGNVRELRHVLIRALATDDQGTITEDKLTFHPPPEATTAAPMPEWSSSVGTLEALERRAIERALARCGNNRKRAAKLLGIARSTLHLRMKKYGLL